jgi:hypothetical protein
MSLINWCVTKAEKLPPTRAILLPFNEYRRAGCSIGSIYKPDGTGDNI